MSLLSVLRELQHAETIEVGERGILQVRHIKAVGNRFLDHAHRKRRQLHNMGRDLFRLGNQLVMGREPLRKTDPISFFAR